MYLISKLSDTYLKPFSKNKKNINIRKKNKNNSQLFYSPVVEVICQFYNSNLRLWILTDSRTHYQYAYFIFLISLSCFLFFFITCQRLHKCKQHTTSKSFISICQYIRNPGTISLYHSFSIELLAVMCIVSLCGGLSSKY